MDGVCSREPKSSECLLPVRPLANLTARADSRYEPNEFPEPGGWTVMTTGFAANGADHEARGKLAPTDRGDEVRDRYDRQLSERLALLLAAEFRRRLEGRQSKERRDG